MKTICFIIGLASCATILSAQTNPAPAAEHVPAPTAESASTQPTPTPTPSPAAATNPPPRVTHIDSDSADFDLNQRTAIYRGHVNVSDPDMNLACEYLVADLPQAGHISHITAETNVLIDFTDQKGEKHHASAARAVYHYALENGTTNETIELTGNPEIQDSQGTMAADKIIWDRMNNGFHAYGQHGTMKVPETSHTNALPFEPSHPTVPSTNRPPVETNRPMAPTNAPTVDTNEAVG